MKTHEVTVNAEKMMRLQGYGIAPSCDASFVSLQARDAVEAIRLRANRLKVWKKGALLAEAAEVVTKLDLDGRPKGRPFNSHGEQPSVAKHANGRRY